MTDLSRIRVAQGVVPETAVRRASSLAHSQTPTAGGLAASTAHRRAIQLATGPAEMSFGRVLEQSLAPERFLVSPEFREWFVAEWARFLQAHFADTVAVAAAFRCAHRTAEYWWNGDHRAGGDLVAQVLLFFPGAIGWFLRAWEGRR